MSKKQQVFLELNLNPPAKQGKQNSPWPKPSLDLFRVIERAGNDKKINGIVFNISSYNADRAALWELRNALEKFKAKGKKLYAFISKADLDLYCFATAADKIIMDKVGILNLLGYVWGRGFAKKTLKKLGIGVRELRYFKYKSAAETFVRDSLSAADRKQYGEILDDVIELTREAVIKARSWTEEEFNSILNNEFLFSAKSALERGLVDYCGRKEAVIEAITAEQKTAEPKAVEPEPAKPKADKEKAVNFVIYGDSASSFSGSKRPYKPARPRKFFSLRPQIAVIYASGVCDLKQGIKAWSLANTIKEAAENKRTKAIVLRISSPGGSAEASEYVNDAIKKAKERVPVVVSMGAVAASGGYWVSMGASHICASALTLTGSIGVISMWFYDDGLTGKLGLKNDFLQRGDHADLMAGTLLPRRDMNRKEEARNKEYIIDLYDDFVGRVAANRNMDINTAESFAQGRVFSGRAALNAGLIDSIGGLDDAINIARSLAKIPEKKKTVYRELPKLDFFEKLKMRFAAAESGITKIAALFLPEGSLALGVRQFEPEPLLEELHHRIANNGQAMPILPLDSGC